MRPIISLSQAATRTGASPISEMMAHALAAPHVISLAAGFVDHASLPIEAVADAAALVLGDQIEGKRSLQYGTTRGDLKLRERLAQRMGRTDALSATQVEQAARQMVVTSGSQQLLYLVSEALLDPGDIVLVEAPTYFVYLGVLERFGARVIGIPTDSGGLRIDALEAALRSLEAAGQLDRVKLIYTITEHSNPSGLSLAADRRPRLLEVVRAWSRKSRLYILEDAAYRGLTFEGPEAPSLWSHDRDGLHVIHARTFSKTFSPGLKVGYGVLPEELMAPVLALKGNHDFGTAHFNQQVLEQVLASGSYDAQVELLARTYRLKCRVMTEALQQHMASFDGAVRWTHPRGGLYVWLTLPEGLDMGRHGPVFARAVEEGVLYVPGGLAFAAEPTGAHGNHARLSFGVAGIDAIREGIRRLSAALAGCLDPVA